MVDLTSQEDGFLFMVALYDLGGKELYVDERYFVPDIYCNIIENSTLAREFNLSETTSVSLKADLCDTSKLDSVAPG